MALSKRRRAPEVLMGRPSGEGTTQLLKALNTFSVSSRRRSQNLERVVAAHTIRSSRRKRASLPSVAKASSLRFPAGLFMSPPGAPGRGFFVVLPRLSAPFCSPGKCGTACLVRYAAAQAHAAGHRLPKTAENVFPTSSFVLDNDYSATENNSHRVRYVQSACRLTLR